MTTFTGSLFTVVPFECIASDAFCEMDEAKGTNHCSEWKKLTEEDLWLLVACHRRIIIFELKWTVSKRETEEAAGSGMIEKGKGRMLTSPNGC